MKKFISISSFLFLVGGSYAIAMEEGDDMGMEMEAPSVSLSGEAELGFKNVDDDNDETEDFHLIRKYQVNFSSHGTTDGGLVFGAGISIEDEHEGDAKQVNGSNVYIGAADGSWKLKLGGNDAGALQAGGIGISDDFLDEGSTAIGLEGKFGGTSYRLTVADPNASGDDDGDWSVGFNHSLGEFSVGLGMDNNSGLAIGLGSEIGGVDVATFYAQNERETVPGVEAMTVTAKDADGNEISGAFTGDVSKIVLSGDHESSFNQEHKGMGVKASMSAGEGATFSIAYSSHKIERVVVGSDVDKLTTTVITTAAKRAQPDLSGIGANDIVFVAEDGVVYQVPTANITVVDGEVTAFATEEARTHANGIDSTEGYLPPYELDDLIIVSTENLADYQLASAVAVEEETATVEPQTVTNVASNNDWNKIELDFTYDLGGGASLNAGIDQLDEDGDKTTTLEAKIAFSF